MAQEKQTVLQHLTELRRRLIAVLAVNLGAAAVCFWGVNYIMDALIRLGKNFPLVYLAPSELFGVYIQVALLCGVILALPFTLFEIWMYISKALYRREKVAVACTLLFAGVFFAGGAYFAYRVVLPTMLDFFLRVAVQGIAPMISVQEFLSFVLAILAGFGVVFEMPVAVGMLSAFGVLRAESLKKHRGAIVVLIFVLAAALTPPDVVSQLMLALPMVVLLEFSVGVCRLICFVKDRRKTAAD